MDKIRTMRLDHRLENFAKHLQHKFVLLCLLFVVTSTNAQFRVEVHGIGLAQVPIAITSFRGQEEAPQNIAKIVQADLERSGQFRKVAADAPQHDERSLPDFKFWRQTGVDSLVSGSVSPENNGFFTVRFRLWDVVKGTDQGGQSYRVSAGDLRLTAHRVADFVYKNITGDNGIFATRIAFVSKLGPQYTLWVADADGENTKPALTSTESIISPAWSPDGSHLAYVSFEARKPVVYTHEIASGKRRLLASFRGSNSAPAWAPDGKKIAVTLSQDGESQLYLLNSLGGTPQRITQSNSIDTEPFFSNDKKHIYFVSDRSGSPQVFRMPSEGGTPERITFDGTYNISPTISPDSKLLAYIARVNGLFKLHVMDMETRVGTSISETVADENPTFSPNGKLIMYATQIQGKEALMLSSIDGKHKARLAAESGDIREPAWSPFSDN